MSDLDRQLRQSQFLAFLTRIDRRPYHAEWNGQVSQSEIEHAQRIPYESDIAP